MMSTSEVHKIYDQLTWYIGRSLEEGVTAFEVADAFADTLINIVESKTFDKDDILDAVLTAVDQLRPQDEECIVLL